LLFQGCRALREIAADRSIFAPPLTPLYRVHQFKTALQKERWVNIMKWGIYIGFHSPHYQLQCNHPSSCISVVFMLCVWNSYLYFLFNTILITSNSIKQTKIVSKHIKSQHLKRKVTVMWHFKLVKIFYIWLTINHEAFIYTNGYWIPT
jgi:hypothetical protein